MPVEGLDPCQELVVVADIDQDLGVGLDSIEEEREGTLGKVILVFLLY